MDKLVAIRIKHNDGTYSNEIPLSVLAINIDWDGTHSLVDVLGNVDLNKGSIQEQINALITTITPDNVQWDLTHTLSDVLGDVDLDKGDLQTQIDNISDGEIQVDSTLTAAGKAADAKAVGDNLKNVVRVGNSNVTNFTSIILGDTTEQVNLLDQSDLIDINTRLNALENSGIQVDQTLSVQGMAADAKAVGDAIDELNDDIETLDNNKQNVLTFDTAPENNSNNPVTSNGIKNALNQKQNVLTFDEEPTEDSQNPVTSDGIYKSIQLITNELGHVTPEMFGAIGDGIADDTNALISAFATGKACLLQNTYLYKSVLPLSGNLFGGGTLKHGSDTIYVNVIADNIIMNDIVFDVNNHTFNAIRTNNVKNITISNCKILNVGNDNTTTSAGGIHIISSENIKIDHCNINYCHVGATKSAYGINIDSSKNIFINNNIISDIAPIGDADGIKVSNTQKSYVYIENNIFKNCYKRCIKMKSEEVYSINNIFIYENLTSLGDGIIGFQRGHCCSIGDTLKFIITDSTIIANLWIVYKIHGPNITIDKFSNELILPDNYSISVSNTSSFLRISPNQDEAAPNIADNLTVSNCKCKGITGYFLFIPTDVAFNSINNLKISDIEFEKNESSSVQSYVFNSNGLSKVNYISIINFKNTGAPVFGQPFFFHSTDLSNTKVFIRGMYNVVPYKNYSYENMDIETEIFSFNATEYRYISLKQKNKNLEFLYTDTSVNPTERTTSAHQIARNCPVGTKFIFPEPIYDANSEKLQIGFICTVAGTSSAVGTCVPLYITMKQPTPTVDSNGIVNF